MDTAQLECMICRAEYGLSTGAHSGGDIFHHMMKYALFCFGLICFQLGWVGQWAWKLVGVWGNFVNISYSSIQIMALGISIIWEIVRNANFLPYPRPKNQKPWRWGFQFIIIHAEVWELFLWCREPHCVLNTYFCLSHLESKWR